MDLVHPGTTLWQEMQYITTTPYTTPNVGWSSTEILDSSDTYVHPSSCIVKGIALTLVLILKVAVAKHLGLIALRLVDSIILPFNLTHYAFELENYLNVYVNSF